MSARPSASDTHGAHEDERNRVHALARHERTVRERERARVRALCALVQPPVPREFQTPIPAAYEPLVIVDHMTAPGSVDDTGFSDGRV